LQFLQFNALVNDTRRHRTIRSFNALLNYSWSWGRSGVK